MVWLTVRGQVDGIRRSISLSLLPGWSRPSTERCVRASFVGRRDATDVVVNCFAMSPRRARRTASWWARSASHLLDRLLLLLLIITPWLARRQRLLHHMTRLDIATHTIASLQLGSHTFCQLTSGYACTAISSLAFRDQTFLLPKFQHRQKTSGLYLVSSEGVATVTVVKENVNNNPCKISGNENENANSTFLSGGCVAYDIMWCCIVVDAPSFSDGFLPKSLRQLLTLLSLSGLWSSAGVWCVCVQSQLVEYYYLWKKSATASTTRPHRQHRRQALRRQAPTPTPPSSESGSTIDSTSLLHIAWLGVTKMSFWPSTVLPWISIISAINCSRLSVCDNFRSIFCNSVFYICWSSKNFLLPGYS